jgi:hypothetical protein
MEESTNQLPVIKEKRDKENIESEEQFIARWVQSFDEFKGEAGEGWPLMAQLYHYAIDAYNQEDSNGNEIPVFYRETGHALLDFITERLRRREQVFEEIAKKTGRSVEQVDLIVSVIDRGEDKEPELKEKIEFELSQLKQIEEDYVHSREMVITKYFEDRGLRGLYRSEILKLNKETIEDMIKSKGKHQVISFFISWFARKIEDCKKNNKSVPSLPSFADKNKGSMFPIQKKVIEFAQANNRENERRYPHAINNGMAPLMPAMSGRYDDKEGYSIARKMAEQEFDKVAQEKGWIEFL